jgi:hypothetical protein
MTSSIRQSPPLADRYECGDGSHRAWTVDGSPSVLATPITSMRLSAVHCRASVLAAVARPESVSCRQKSSHE